MVAALTRTSAESNFGASTFWNFFFWRLQEALPGLEAAVTRFIQKNVPSSTASKCPIGLSTVPEIAHLMCQKTSEPTSSRGIALQLPGTNSHELRGLPV
jgi:hypothetical protein